MAEVLLRVESLTFAWRPGFPLLENVYLQADRGEILGIVGRNGSGKTTLFDCLSARDARTSTVFFDGRWLDPAKRHRHIAILPQDSFLPRQLRVKDLLKAFCSSLDLDKDAETMKTLQPVMNQPSGVLSGGERRLVEFLMVLAMDQEVLILDEPFSELAPLLTEHMVVLLRRHLGKRAAIIADHDWLTVKNVCTRLLMLKDRELVPVPDDRALLSWGYLAGN